MFCGKSRNVNGRKGCLQSQNQDQDRYAINKWARGMDTWGSDDVTRAWWERRRR